MGEFAINNKIKEGTVQQTYKHKKMSKATKMEGEIIEFWGCLFNNFFCEFLKSIKTNRIQYKIILLLKVNKLWVNKGVNKYLPSLFFMLPF